MQNNPLLPMLSQIFDQMPFNKVLGLTVTRFAEEGVEVCFGWSEQLVGNPVQKILHGGVIASVLDVAGGIMAIATALERLNDVEPAELVERLGKMSTIDIRTDYLRPGRGVMFTATARVIRAGNKVAVCRMELHNEQGVHIALGTGTYLVG
ncbi:thioesterase family protein [Rheinheimera baltica]|uniref:Medium/long-chain acyl-CoA thioesterase YigI n=1 Tax=Rheinheimera baltica TaxID=67576 RepID=A0ABT9HY32_9GAMM|nr:thioesterase family protein [Rheinheimera baltica]MDP5136026.1 thioesterase family protein [Rheinheimera baltica]MDP5142076.1 thioesterase family protein [Rheinheimera baltica]MDP5150551.1 thioesterase family protein [Rheinheimera baltica]MDP5189269.1 thioesterase family protein [Rheinheimera baltica]